MRLSKFPFDDLFQCAQPRTGRCSHSRRRAVRQIEGGFCADPSNQELCLRKSIGGAIDAIRNQCEATKVG
jgi:hypothetical protein